MKNKYGAYIVSWDFTNGENKGVLIVGQQKDGKMNIVNAFQNEDAIDIYRKLAKDDGE